MRSGLLEESAGEPCELYDIESGMRTGGVFAGADQKNGFSATLFQRPDDLHTFEAAVIDILVVGKNEWVFGSRSNTFPVIKRAGVGCAGM